MTLQELQTLNLHIGDIIEVHDTAAMAEKCYRLVELKAPPLEHYRDRSNYSPHNIVADSGQCLVGHWVTSVRGAPYSTEWARSGAFPLSDLVLVQVIKTRPLPTHPSWIDNAMVKA